MFPLTSSLPLFSLLLSLLLPPSTSSSSPSLQSFSDLLLQKFEHQSRSSLVEEELAKLSRHIRVRPEYPQAALLSATTQLERLIEDRVAALRRLASAAEDAARQYIHDTPEDEFDIPLDELACEKEQRRLNSSDVRRTAQEADTDETGVHLNIESYRCDPRVRRDFGWTGSTVVEKAMKESRREQPGMGHQYIGTYSGLTRMYPRRRWEIKPSQITVDLFDPKFRPWFVNAESTPKDIVFLVDFSGSVKGPTMHLIKLTIMYILSTLTPNDHFYGVYFNSGFGPVLSCHNNTFLPATTVNKKVFFEKLSSIEEKDQAHLGPPLQFALDALRENLDSNSSLFSHSRSGGHKLMMLFTDGVDEWPHQVLEHEVKEGKQDPIRIFGFSMGYGSGQLPLLQWMACNTFASYSVIDSIMDVKPQSRAFLDLLSRQRAKAIEKEKIEERTVSWTDLYMEAQGLGPTVSLSMPVLNRQDGTVWRGQGLAGVAGIDIALSELTAKLPSGDQIYAFIVDSNNGIVLYHPKLVLPKTEIHCVRRSACYDASRVRWSKTGEVVKGLRVQYGFSDQRVYRLVGLIDSIPAIDMFEVEGNSSALIQLRRRIMDGACDETSIVEGDREFYCSHLRGSPFSLVLVNSAVRQTVYHTPEVETMKVVDNPLVGYYLSKRDICNWSLDRLPAPLRFNALSSLSDCPHDLSLTKALVSAVAPWAESWPQSGSSAPSGSPKDSAPTSSPHSPPHSPFLSPSSTSCDETRLPTGFDARFFVNSFVHTRTQVSAHYPSCASTSMKAVGRKMDEERLTKDPARDLQISVREDLVIAYRSLADKYGNRLATVGVQWRMDFLDQLFHKWIRENEQWSSICKKKDCLLVSRSGFVVASSTRRRPAHLSQFDSQLFASLDEEHLVTVTPWVDAQAECAAKRVAPWSSPAPATRSPIRTIVDAVVSVTSSTFWVDVYFLLNSWVSAQPSMTGGLCKFQRIKPVERCFLRHTDYTMTLNITKQIQLRDIKCSRFARVVPVPGSFLTLIEVDHACPGYKPDKTYPFDPEKLDGCEKVNLFERRQQSFSNNYSTLDENPSPECQQDSTSVSSGTPIPLIATVLLAVQQFNL